LKFIIKNLVMYCIGIASNYCAIASARQSFPLLLQFNKSHRFGAGA
jgi:hypothetical protein